MELIKKLSDKLILWLLHATSEFGKQLTREGRREQQMWREQRLRNLKGLAIRSRQRLDAKKVSSRPDEQP
jgi:hypothetical protein